MFVIGFKFLLSQLRVLCSADMLLSNSRISRCISQNSNTQLSHLHAFAETQNSLLLVLWRQWRYKRSGSTLFCSTEIIWARKLIADLLPAPEHMVITNYKSGFVRQMNAQQALSILLKLGFSLFNWFQKWNKFMINSVKSRSARKSL